MSFIEPIKIASSTILYSSYITIRLYISLRAYIVANTLTHKLIKLFYKIFKKVVAIVFDCVIICSSKGNKLNKK